MANEIGGAKDGLAAVLSTIGGLRVLDYPAASLNELPAAVVLFESREPMRTMGVGSFVGKIKVVVVVSSADAKQSYDDLDGFMDPRGAHSVEAAIDADNTWGGKVDDGRLVSIDNVGRRKLWGSTYLAADFHLKFLKRMAE